MEICLYTNRKQKNVNHLQRLTAYISLIETLLIINYIEHVIDFLIEVWPPIIHRIVQSNKMKTIHHLSIYTVTQRESLIDQSSSKTHTYEERSKKTKHIADIENYNKT